MSAHIFLMLSLPAGAMLPIPVSPEAPGPGYPVVAMGRCEMGRLAGGEPGSLVGMIFVDPLFRTPS